MWAHASGAGSAREGLTGAGPGAPRRRAVSLAVAAALAAWATPAGAVCTPISGTMTFTGYSPLGAGVAATATIAYTCVGRNPAAALAISTPRVMTAGADALAFELYTDASRTVRFPDGATTLPIPTTSGTVTVHGYLSPQPDAGAGLYAVPLTVTLTSGNPGNQVRVATLTVTTAFLGTCSIQPGTLSFGAYDPLSTAPRDATGTIAIACTRNTRYAVGLGEGTHAAGTTRQLAGPAGGLLRYELYADPARSTPWTATATVDGVAPGTAPIPLVVHGRIPAGQLAPAGEYGDVIQSTVNF